MTWNYRVVKETDGTYRIREVYYDDDGSIKAWTAEDASPLGETEDEIRADVERISQALSRPVLNVEDL